MAQNQKPKKEDPILQAVAREGLFGKSIPDAREFQEKKPAPERLALQPEEQRKLNDMLLEAAVLGKRDEIIVLLRKGADINARSPTGMTPLMLAAAGRQIGAVSIILDAGADRDARNNENLTASEIAMKAGQLGLEGIAKLIDDYGIKKPIPVVKPDPNKLQTTEEHTELKKALWDAIEKGRPDLLEELIGMGADVNEMCDATTEMTPLHSAASLGDSKIIKLLLDAGADVEAQAVYSTPLMYAALSGKTNAVRMLLYAGADVNHVNSHDGQNALHMAAMYGHIDVADILLNVGINTDVFSMEGDTPLHLAVLLGKTEFVEFLKKNGVTQ